MTRNLYTAISILFLLSSCFSASRSGNSIGNPVIKTQSDLSKKIAQQFINALINADINSLQASTTAPFQDDGKCKYKPTKEALLNKLKKEAESIQRTSQRIELKSLRLLHQNKLTEETAKVSFSLKRLMDGGVSCPDPTIQKYGLKYRSLPVRFYLVDFSIPQGKQLGENIEVKVVIRLNQIDGFWKVTGLDS